MNETKVQDLEELKLYLQNFIVDDFEKALEELNNVLERKKQLDIIGFKSRYNRDKKETQKGELTKEQERVNHARLANAYELISKRRKRCL